jgi:TatD DNase family protein
MLLHDTHVHLEMLCEWEKIISPEDQEPTQELTKFIQKELENHEFAIQATVDTNNFLRVHNLFKDIDKIKFLYGSHPEIVNADFEVQKYLQNYQQTIKNNHFQRFLGLGECGLDYYYSQDLNIKNKQNELFEYCLDLAIELKKPIVLHIREAFEDLFKILKNKPEIHGKFLVHCFTGTSDELKKVLDFGGVAAFGGILTFGQNADYLRQAFKYCPLESLVFETDLPYLAPKPNRGKTNLPKFIQAVVELASELKSTSPEMINQHSRQNTQKLFKFQT